MEKQRMFKMGQLEQDMLVKALCDTQNDVRPEQAEEMRSLALRKPSVLPAAGCT